MFEIQPFLYWYLTVQILGLALWPLTRRIFKRLPDRGWGFGKILGVLTVSYLVWLLGSIKLVPFTRISVVIVVGLVGGLVWMGDWFLRGRELVSKVEGVKSQNRGGERFPQGINLKLIVIEEILFLVALGGWTWVRAHNPDIRGLEKFMDHGFVMSILRGKHFPPLDHFLSGQTINYYYFGHLMAAVLTRLSGVKPAVAFNLQIANLFALTVLESFVIGVALSKLTFFPLISRAGDGVDPDEGDRRWRERVCGGWEIFAGFLSTLFVAVIGNLHLAVEYLKGEMGNYWYASASRVIAYTINEFPVYSFVVADLHGHVSDLPVVLLFIGGVISLVAEWKELGDGGRSSAGLKILGQKGLSGVSWGRMALSAFLLGVMYATNSWDFAVYGGLLGLLFFFFNYQRKGEFFVAVWKAIQPFILVILLSAVIFLPFWLSVQPISQGFGWVYTRSPIKDLFLLWGFFFVLGVIYLSHRFGYKVKDFLRVESMIKFLAGVLGVEVEVKGKALHSPEKEKGPVSKVVSQRGALSIFHLPDFMVIFFFLYALILIAAPEIVYIKDIYAVDYYRANTMFKLYYQAWILIALAVACGTVEVIRQVIDRKTSLAGVLTLSIYCLMLIAVLPYPYVAVKSNFWGTSRRVTLDGSYFLKKVYPHDAEAIEWFNEEIEGQPVIVEAVGESYTDFSRICAHTGLPAVLGWPVHEWLWRGTWDIPGGRQEEVKQIYESKDMEKVSGLLQKYGVKFIYLGEMEREKYPHLSEDKFGHLGKVVYENEGVRVYSLDLGG